ncbi:hypothetical protein ISR94_00525 [Candidatus Microgenomates bacterium]|nr:hypothetical protein [Candidatus Microgenomates bacterium]
MVSKASKTTQVSEGLVQKIVVDSEKRLTKQIEEIDKKNEKRFDKVMNHLDKMAGGFKKFDEEQIMLSGQMSDRTDRIEKLETFAFSN